MPNEAPERVFDTVIVGGGLAGLIAAVELAQGGRSVTLFEKAKHVGGRAITTRRREADWNLGAHALYRRGEAARILGRLGVPFSGNSPRASGGFAIADGRKHALPGGFVSLLSTSLLKLPAKLELANLLSSLPRVDANELRSLTLNEWLTGRVRNESVRALVRALARLTTYCDAPDEVVAGDVVAQIQLALSSNVLYLDGGWQSLVNGLQAAAEKAEVSISTSVAVRSIEGAPETTGVRLDDGTLVRARSIVAAVPPEAFAELAPQADPEFLVRLKGLVPVRAACLDVTLSSLPVTRATFALGIDQPVYFSVHSAVARLAPPPMAVIHVMKYLRPGSAAAEPHALEHELEGVLDLVQPAWRTKLVDRRFLPALAVSHGLPQAKFGGTSGRPRVDGAGIGGLYVCGDWTGERGFIADASAASAHAAAEKCEAFLSAQTGSSAHAARAA